MWLLRVSRQVRWLGRVFFLGKQSEQSFSVLTMDAIDDFEVAVFLTETSSRHSILRKVKTAKTEKGRLGTMNGKMTGTRDAPVEVGEGDPQGLIAEEGEESEDVHMGDIASATVGGNAVTRARLPKDESQEGLFVSEHSDEEDVDAREMSSSVNGGEGHAGEEEDGEEDEKKKLGMDTTYDGFSIYGRILCLVVKRKGIAKGKEMAGGAGQAVMEDWIASTQMQEGSMMDE